MSPKLPSLVLFAACFSVGCSSSSGGGGGVAIGPLDFTLRLRPLTPLNQPDVFDDVDSYTVTVDRGGDDVEVYDLGSASGDGSVTTPELAALEGAAVGVYGYGAGGELVAYGRSSAWTLPSDADDDVPILIGRVGAMGRLTDLPGDTELVGGGLVSDGTGRFLTFGGDERGTDGTDHATSSILRMDIGRPNTNLSFVRIDDLPEYETVNDTTAEGLAGHTTTRLAGNHDFQGWVLIAGGAQGMVGSSTVTDQVLLFDPVDEDTIALGSAPEEWEGTYHHTADEFGSGYVALLGGGSGRSNSQPVSDRTISFARAAAVFEPRAKAIEGVLTGPDNGPLFLHDAATVDNQFVLSCGGLDVTGGGSRWTASTQCDTLDDSFVLTRVDDPNHDLPLPLIHHDMTALPDGRVLLTGGFTTEGEVGDGGTVTASDDIWAYSAEKGWEYVGALNVARGQHRVSVLQDGTVLVVGGSISIAGPLWDAEDPTGCIEIINPSALGNAKIVGECDDDGLDGELSTGVFETMVGSDPDYGTLIVGGADSSGDSTGQVAWYVGGIVEP